MQKILVTTGIFPPSVGGPATYSKLLSDELPKRGIGVEVLSFDGVRFLPKIIRHLVFSLKIIVRSRNVSIIYAQDTVSVGLPSALVAGFLGKKFWLRVPGDYAWEQSRQRYGVSDSIDDFQNKKYSKPVERLRSIQKFVAGRAQRIIVPSDYFKELVSGWVENPDKVYRVYNGIELNRSLARTPGHNVIFSSGRLVPWKGFDVLIDVTLCLKQKYSDIKLRIAGDGPEKERLVEKSNESVSFLGFISKDKIREELSKASVYVLNTSFESFSFAVVEAMWAGVPVVATRVGNLSEIIEDGKSGLLVEPDNKEELSMAVEKILSDPGFASNLSESAKKRAQDFSIENTLSELIKLIKNETDNH